MSTERRHARPRRVAALCWLATTALGPALGCDDSVSFGASGPTSSFGTAGVAGGLPFGGAGEPTRPTPLTGGAPAPPTLPAMDAGAVHPSCPSPPRDCELRIAQLRLKDAPCLLELVGLDVIDPPRACRGELLLDEQAVPCGGADGWQITADGRYVLLFGEACAAFASGATATAAFPCDLACPIPVTPPPHDDDAGTPEANAAEDAGAD